MAVRSQAPQPWFYAPYNGEGATSRGWCVASRLCLAARLFGVQPGVEANTVITATTRYSSILSLAGRRWSSASRNILLDPDLSSAPIVISDPAAGHSSANGRHIPRANQGSGMEWRLPLCAFLRLKRYPHARVKYMVVGLGGLLHGREVLKKASAYAMSSRLLEWDGL